MASWLRAWLERRRRARAERIEEEYGNLSAAEREKLGELREDHDPGRLVRQRPMYPDDRR
jgi:hypothetical protein